MLETSTLLSHRQIQKMPESGAQICAITTRSTKVPPVPDLSFTSLGYTVVFTMSMFLGRRKWPGGGGGGNKLRLLGGSK